MYWPGGGRFLQPDPIGYAGGVNLYAYVRNDPLNYVDRRGLAAETSQGSSRSGNVQLACAFACPFLIPAIPPGVEAGVAILGTIGIAIGGSVLLNKVEGAGEEKPSLLDPQGEQHILEGDRTGGGHRAGTGRPGKSEFPSGWSDERIKGEISDVATDPASSRTPGRGGRTVVRGTRGGIDIEVIVDSRGRIVTGYPTNVPRNPR